MRPSRDEWALQLALLTAQRSTCLRRAVGCILLNARGHVLATGYNGVAAGQKHCNDPLRVSSLDTVVVRDQTVYIDKDGQRFIFPHACEGTTSPSGTNLDACQAIHAEQNALLQCRDIYAIDTCYVTVSPCITCAKLLLNTSCQRIVFGEPYPQPAAKVLWVTAGRTWDQLKVKI